MVSQNKIVKIRCGCDKKKRYLRKKTVFEIEVWNLVKICFLCVCFVWNDVLVGFCFFKMCYWLEFCLLKSENVPK